MNSEKVKEIKKALKCCSEGKCEKCLISQQLQPSIMTL